MKILICGATGFIGRHLATSLKAAGHTVLRGVRKPSQAGDIAVDFCKDISTEVWLSKLDGVEVVINAVGVLRESKAQPMHLLHEQAPIALFSACEAAGIKRIVQVTALGIEQGIEKIYYQSRRASEAYLHKLPATLPYLILRPSYIYSEDSVRTRMFRILAELPVHILPAGGRQLLQPVHIDDICEAVCRWLDDEKALGMTVACVGAEAVDMRGLLDSYRQQLQRPKALHLHVPAMLVEIGAKLGDFMPSSPLCSDTLAILNAGNTGDASEFADLLGRQPRSYRGFISTHN